ncbi:MAG: UDP-N-acetylglucosamine 2-epimerase (non-hydrolyzing) [Candidatus Magasanikbacteria bacterium]
MKKLKLMTIVGTRPEIIRLSEVIKKCDTFFEHILVHTGQNWDKNLSDIFFENLGLRQPDHFLDIVGKNLGESMGNIIASSYRIIKNEKPDALLVLGDTNSALSVIAAKRLKVPIFHMEAGNRCFDQNVPEEINRKIVDHVSDMNLAYTEHSRRYLLSEGVQKDRVVVTGSPLAEVLSVNAESINCSSVLEKFKIKKGKFFLLSMHREENIDIEKNFNSLCETINGVAEKYKIPVIYSVHPRSRKRIDENGVEFHPLVRLVEPLGFFDYNFLQKNAFCVISDSGSLSEESAMSGFPAVLIRTSTERPEALDAGSILIGGIELSHVVNSIEMITSYSVSDGHLNINSDYQDLNVSDKVVKIIQGYTRIIKKNTWGID